MSQDIQKDVEFLASNNIIYLAAFSPELTITNWVSRNAEEFEEIIDSFNKYAIDENYSEDIRNAFTNIIKSLQEIRARIGIKN